MDAKRIRELKDLATRANSTEPCYTPSKEEWKVIDECMAAVPELVSEVERLQKIVDQCEIDVNEDPKCEGCDNKATKYDIDHVPLCDECYASACDP